METLLLRLRDLVWPAVLATILAGSGVLVAIVSPEKDTLVLALGWGGSVQGAGFLLYWAAAIGGNGGIAGVHFPLEQST